MTLQPRFKLLYLVAVVLAGLSTRAWPALAALCVFQAALWLGNGLPPSGLVRAVRRLAFFFLAMLLAFALLPGEAGLPEAWRQCIFWGFHLKVNMNGVVLSGSMTLRMVAVIWASSLVQMTGAPDDFVRGLRELRVPERAALTLHATLSMLGAQRPEKGKGRAARAAQEDGASARGSLKRFLQCNGSPLADLVESELVKSKRRPLDAPPGTSAETLHDAAVLSGLCGLMLSVKLVKILPGIPFAPGFKIAWLLPLYILSAELTHTPFGATITGTTMGVVSFLSGDGRFGVFEILKYVASGATVDLGLPLARRLGRFWPTAAYVLLGSAAAAAQVLAAMVVVWFVSGNAALYAIAGLQGLSMVFFGALSGVVTAGLMRSLGRFKTAGGPAGQAQEATHG